MLQPFELFKEDYVDRLIKLNKKFLLSQSYRAGADLFSDAERRRTPLLISAYDNHGLAKTHFNAVRGDRYAAIIHLERGEHRKKFCDMLGPGSAYLIFFAAIRSAGSLQRHLDANYRHHMRRWIDTHTTWRITKDALIKPSLQLIFGILHIQLKYAGQTVKITFEELEKA